MDHDLEAQRPLRQRYDGAGAIVGNHRVDAGLAATKGDAGTARPFQ